MLGNFRILCYAEIAQLVERLICNQRVGSSSLSFGTSYRRRQVVWSSCENLNIP